VDFLEASTPLSSFAALELRSEYSAALKAMSVFEPTAVQGLAIATALRGGDFIAIAQTGSGETLAFALSILKRFEKSPTSRALILVPSREMALQTARVFEGLCAEAPISASVVIGGIPDNKQNSQLKKNPRLVIATPGRLNDLLKGNKLLLQNVDTLVIDEADRMLDLGFGPQLESIQKTMRGQWQSQMYSASFNPKLESLARIFMREPIVMIRTERAERPVSTLKQRVLLMTSGMKNERLQDELKAVTESVIVFTADQESCERVGNYLREYAHSVDLVHGALSQGHRSRVLKDFRDGSVRILVATDLMARGIDVASIALVVNYDLPPQSEDFIHRIGRTARMGRPGTAVTFVTPADYPTYRRLSSQLQGAEEISLVQNFKFLGIPSAESPTVRVDSSYRPAGATKESPSKQKKKKYGASKKKS
jgi:superfamily II DNA/RNA helicase